MTEAQWKTQDPLSLFGEWLTEAKQTAGIREPTAMALATYSPKQGLSNRVVLLKSHSNEGFRFYTNYDSAKGRSLAEQAEAAAVFYWDPIGRQVRLTGPVTRLPRSESEAYWASRARESQLSQCISQQSQPVDGRETLERLVREAEKEFAGRAIPCPPHWGGYLLKPGRMEFWESRPGRLHERFLFTRTNGGWSCTRLYP